MIRKLITHEVFHSLVYKIMAIAISFVVIRQSIAYLGVQQFGNWVYLLTIISFATFSDFGISNGLKNKLARAISEEDKYKQKQLISTTYTCLIVLSLSIFIIFSLASSAAIATNLIKFSSYYQATFITLSCVLLNLVLSVSVAIYSSYGVNQLITLSQLLNQIIVLTGLFLAEMYLTPDLIAMAVIYGSSLILSNLMILAYFSQKVPQTKPDLRLFKTELALKVIKLGGQFFYLQFCIFIILISDKILAGNLLNSEAVAQYEVLYKYYGIVIVVHTIANIRAWPKYTKYVKSNEYRGLVGLFEKMVKFTLLLMIITFSLVLLAPIIFSIWLPNESNSLTILEHTTMATLVSVIIWFSTLAYLSNGMEVLKLQKFCVTIAAIINVPLTFILVSKMELGLSGIMIATTISLLIYCISGTVDYLINVRPKRT